jgi:5-methylcytosine-specific restriction endonuclease McrA
MVSARRTVSIVLTVAHLNHTPGDDREENLMALCQWCHLNYDRLHHKETRSDRKDARRPLLMEAK